MQIFADGRNSTPHHLVLSLGFGVSSGRIRRSPRIAVNCSWVINGRGVPAPAMSTSAPLRDAPLGAAMPPSAPLRSAAMVMAALDGHEGSLPPKKRSRSASSLNGHGSTPSPPPGRPARRSPPQEAPPLMLLAARTPRWRRPARPGALTRRRRPRRRSAARPRIPACRRSARRRSTAGACPPRWRRERPAPPSHAKLKLPMAVTTSWLQHCSNECLFTPVEHWCSLPLPARRAP